MTTLRTSLALAVLVSATCPRAVTRACELRCVTGTHFVRIVATDARAAFCEDDAGPVGPFLLEENVLFLTGVLVNGHFTHLDAASLKDASPHPASLEEHPHAAEYLRWRTSGLARFLDARQPAATCS